MAESTKATPRCGHHGNALVDLGSPHGLRCAICFPEMFVRQQVERMSVSQVVSFLVQASRVSPQLRAAVAVVEDELQRLTAREERLTAALRLACSDGWSDIDGAMDFYLRKVGSRWPELDRVSEATDG